MQHDVCFEKQADEAHSEGDTDDGRAGLLHCWFAGNW
jgi:hypothetical protein